jgi:hypothetical protein
MAQIAAWMFAITIAVSGMLITAATEMYALHFAVGAITATFIAISAVRDHRLALDGGAGKVKLAAIVSRHMGMLWAWAAISTLITYQLLITWTTNWMGIFLILVMGAAACLFIANILQREADAGDPDDHLVDLVNLIAKLQFAAMCVIIGGLIAAGRFGADAFGGQNKWAAVNILLCAGIGLAVLSGFTALATRSALPLRSAAKTQSGTAATQPIQRRRRPAARAV